jgi:hypothetical protein
MDCFGPSQSDEVRHALTRFDAQGGYRKLVPTMWRGGSASAWAQTYCLSQTVVMLIATPSPFTPIVIWVETLPSFDTTVLVV